MGKVGGLGRLCGWVAFLLGLLVGPLPGWGTEYRCRPTPYDEIGPFYRPNAPERSMVGQGLVLSGRVRSAVDCRAVVHARIEFWLVGPQGTYDADHRGTVYSDRQGRYRITTNFPPAYVGRPPHVHFLITAVGYERLITQYYPTAARGTFDLVLEPASAPAAQEE